MPLRRRRLYLESLERRALLTTFFVDGDVGQSGADGTAESPFATIQEGVAAAIATPGDDEVVIAPRTNGGAYQGTVQIGGGAPDAGKLMLRGATGLATDVVLTTSSGVGISIDAAFEVTLRDFKIDRPASHGILSRSESSVTIDNVHVVSAGLSGGVFHSGIIHQRGDLIVRNCTLNNNWQGIWSAEWRDSADEQTILSRPNNLTVIETYSQANRVNGVYARNATGTLALIDVTLIGNNVNGLHAHALHSLTIEGGEFIDNQRDGISIQDVQSPTIAGGSLLGNSYSGLWANHTPNLTISNTTATSNGLHGLKIANADGVLIDGVISDKNGKFDGNSTAGGGGIGILPGTAAPIVISNSKVTNNKARGNGGGIEIWAMNSAFQADVSVSTTEISGNAVATDTGRHGGGVAIFGYSNLVLTDALIDGNTASGTAGVHFQSSGTATNGGFPTLSVIDSTISGNVAVPNGSGTAIQSAGLTQLGGWLEMTGSTISGNQGGDSGGARLESLGGHITNSTMSGNQGMVVGGVDARVGRNELRILHSTVTANRGGVVGGLRSEWEQVTLGNSVVAGNTTGDASSGSQAETVSDLAGRLTSVGGNLFGESDAVVITAANPSTSGDQTGTATEPLNPHLGPLQDNGGLTRTHAPLTGSPLIDRGSDTISDLPTADQRGAARPQGITFDIGAVEDVVYTPLVEPTEEVLNLDSAHKGSETVSIVVHAPHDSSIHLIDHQSLVWASGRAFGSAVYDVDGDGDDDLFLNFKLRELDLVDRYRDAMIADDSKSQHQVKVPLTGTTLAGEPVLGAATVDLVMTGKSLQKLLDSIEG